MVMERGQCKLLSKRMAWNILRQQTNPIIVNRCRIAASHRIGPVQSGHGAQSAIEWELLMCSQFAQPALTTISIAFSHNITTKPNGGGISSVTPLCPFHMSAIDRNWFLRDQQKNTSKYLQGFSSWVALCLLTGIGNGAQKVTNFSHKQTFLSRARSHYDEIYAIMHAMQAHAQIMSSHMCIMVAKLSNQAHIA